MMINLNCNKGLFLTINNLKTTIIILIRRRYKRDRQIKRSNI